MPQMMTILILFVLSTPLFAADRPTVWFDQAHGQAFRIDQQGPLHLTDFARMLVKQDCIVETSQQELSFDILKRVDALVLSGAFKPYSAKEITAIEQFLRGGGRLAVMLHIAPPLAELLHHFGVDFSNGVIREQDHVLAGDALNFRVTELGEHELNTGLQGFNIYGGWALTNFDQRARIIARTGPRAWVDLNRDRRFGSGDAVQSFGVAVTGELGRGAFVVFADDAIFQNQFLPENRELADNLAHWLLKRPVRQLAWLER